MSRQAGLSMVELLVALAISSFLILGITQIYIDNKRNYLFQQGQTTNIENGRYTLLILEQELAKAGYRRQPDSEFEFSFPAQTAEGCNFAAGQTITYVDEKSFCIRYQPAFTDAKDCEGNDVEDIPSQPYTTFEEDPIVARFEFDDETEELRCNSQPIANGIVDIRFEYGINSNDAKIVNSYKLAPGSNDEIRTIRYSALTATSAQLSDTSDSAAYKQWSAKYLDDAETPDRRLYSRTGSTISIRNRLP